MDVKGFEFNYIRPVAHFYPDSTNTVRATINASFPHLYAAASAVDDALDEFEGMHGTLPGAAAEDALLLKTPVAILNHLHQSTANLTARRTTMLQRLKQFKPTIPSLLNITLRRPLHTKAKARITSKSSR